MGGDGLYKNARWYKIKGTAFKRLEGKVRKVRETGRAHGEPRGQRRGRWDGNCGTKIGKGGDSRPRIEYYSHMCAPSSPPPGCAPSPCPSPPVAKGRNGKPYHSRRPERMFQGDCNLVAS